MCENNGCRVKNLLFRHTANIYPYTYLGGETNDRRENGRNLN